MLAAGSGSRMGANRNKAYLPLRGRWMVLWSLDAATQACSRVVLVTRADDIAAARAAIADEGLRVDVIEGGASRHESEFKVLNYLAPDIESGAVDVVLMHDAARPLAGADMMRTAIETARAHGGAVPVVPAPDLVRIDQDGATHPVADLVRVQTPQAFRALPLLRAYRDADVARFEGTDTSSSVERFTDLEVRTFSGSQSNLKVTYAPDLVVAERLLS